MRQAAAHCPSTKDPDRRISEADGPVLAPRRHILARDSPGGSATDSFVSVLTFVILRVFPLYTKPPSDISNLTSFFPPLLPSHNPSI